ncbi:MAG: HEAT repeat domain-containing protein [Verrucomicrobiales bacterium]|nr:HEAT repeat domain-containing protein [Verrucomicrobiales bacterium]
MSFKDSNHRLFLALALAVAIGVILVGCGCRPSAGVPDLTEQKLKATDWHTRQQLADDLAKDRSAGSFEALLRLLKDQHEDVSYSAAEALEARADTDRAHDLTTAIAQLPRERRWPAYRALRNYSGTETSSFLVNSLAEELEYYRVSQTFDDRNCHYIAKSIEELTRKVPALGGGMKAPIEGRREDFAQFLAQAKSALGLVQK